MSLECRSGFQHENAVAGSHLASATDEMDRLLDQKEERGIIDASGGGHASGFHACLHASGQIQPDAGSEQRP